MKWVGMYLVMVALAGAAHAQAVGVSSTLAVTPSVPQLTLHDVLARVARSAPQLRAAELAADADAARSRSRFGSMLPHVNYEGDWSVRDATTGATHNTSHPRGDSLVLVQPLTLGEELAGWKSARNTARASAFDAASTRQNLLVQTAAAYGDWLAAEDEAANTRTLLEAVEHELKGANLRLKLGEGTKTDVAQSEARVAAAKSTLATAMAKVAGARASLARYAGPLDGNPVWPATTEIPPAAANHPLVAAAEARKAASRFDVRGAWADFLPEATLRASSNQSRDTTFLGGNTVEDQTVLVTVSLPLFAGGQNVANLQAAKAEARRAHYTLEDTRRELARLHATAVADVEAARAAVAAAEQEVAALARAAEGVRREQQLGTRSLLEVLNAEQELAAGRTRLATAKRNALVAEFNLLAAEGRLAGR
ncbi:MAG: TolC family protein [Pseudomonadaceae bacterium]|nr:TolC family protein [Pseudomonadaceae bacterium]